jgi:hypothetical protein
MISVTVHELILTTHAEASQYWLDPFRRYRVGVSRLIETMARQFYVLNLVAASHAQRASTAPYLHPRRLLPAVARGGS